MADLEPTERRAGGSAPPRWLTIAAVVIGGLGQVIVLVPFTVASGLLAPLWGVAFLYGLWLACAALLIWTARRRPLLAPLVPVLNAVLWFATMTVGDIWLGWTA